MEKSKKSINVEGGFLFCGGWNFFKSVSVGSTFIREMRVLNKEKSMFHTNDSVALTKQDFFRIEYDQIYPQVVHFRQYLPDN